MKKISMLFSALILAGLAFGSLACGGAGGGGGCGAPPTETDQPTQ